MSGEEVSCQLKSLNKLNSLLGTICSVILTWRKWEKCLLSSTGRAIIKLGWRRSRFLTDMRSKQSMPKKVSAGSFNNGLPCQMESIHKCLCWDGCFWPSVKVWSQLFPQKMKSLRWSSRGWRRASVGMNFNKTTLWLSFYSIFLLIESRSWSFSKLN